MKTLIRILQNAGINAAVNFQSGDNVITISGTPTASEPFNYSIPLTGGCRAVNATGTTPVPQTINEVTPLCIIAKDTWTRPLQAEQGKFQLPCIFIVCGLKYILLQTQLF